jgi:hypothetical protein
VERPSRWILPKLAGSKLVRRIADAGLVTAAKVRTRRLDRMDAAEVQARTLLKLVRKAVDTRFGREHGFDRIESVADFQARVPLRDYEQFWDGYWKAAYPRLDDITWPGRFPYYALSSGTTSGATKYIPISRAMVRSNKKAAFTTMAFFRNAFRKHPILTGKFFFLGGCTDLRRQDDGSLAGDLSGIAAKEMMAAARPYVFPPADLSFIPDWTVKIQKLAERSVREPITAISGVPSWMLKLFDVVKQVSGKRTIAEVWPTLRLVIHGGTKFDSFRNTFQAEIGSDEVKFCEVYPCSEGFIATEDPRHHLLRVIPDHRIFFEFIPVSEFRDGQLASARPTRHTLATVEPGVVYAIALSNCSGMWAYLVGDTVTFESRTPPLIRFTGRTKNFLSAFGEHLIEEEVERAVSAAATACGVLTADHHVGPVFPTDPKRPGHHLYLIEFRGPPPADLGRFAALLDAELRRLNEDYDAHRVGDLTMLVPEVRAVPAGGFERWMKARGKEGGQNKVPRMDNTGQMTAALALWMATHDSGSPDVKTG